MNGRSLRIAVLTSSYPRFPGDTAAPFMQAICENLAALGHDVEVVAPYDPVVQPTDSQGLKIHRFHYIWPRRLHIMGHARSLKADVHLDPLAYLLLPFFLISAFFALLRITSKQKTQVIYNHWVIPNGLVAAWVARIRHIPFVVTLHGSDIYLARKVRSFGWVASWIFRRSSAVTTNSPELRQAALDLGAPQNTALVSFGGDPLAFNPSSRSDAFRRSLAPDPSAVIVAALGRFVYKKGFDILLSAFPDVLRECPQAVMVLGGDGPLMNDLKRQADLAGISQWVLFPGRIPWDQVPEFLASADIFVISSIRDQYGNVDGCPTVLFEAMSVGVPVIASDIGGVSLVVKNGQNGVLVPPGDAHVLSQTITTLIRDQQMRQAIAVDARRTIETHHNWYNVAVQLSSILDGVVHGSNTPT